MPRGQRSENWTPEMRAKISAARKGKPGHPRSPETRKKIGAGARNTRNNEKKPCPYGCGMVSNNGAIARHVKREHEFVCAVGGCEATRHKGRGLCVVHHGIDCVARQFDLTVHDYVAQYHAQNGECFLCNRPGVMRGTPGAKRRDILTMDHCHASGDYRGMICQSCNLTLGHAHDRIDVLQRMIEYLSK